MSLHDKERRLLTRPVVLFAYHLNAFVRLNRGSVEVIV